MNSSEQVITSSFWVFIKGSKGQKGGWVGRGGGWGGRERLRLRERESVLMRKRADTLQRGKHRLTVTVTDRHTERQTQTNTVTDRARQANTD